MALSAPPMYWRRPRRPLRAGRASGTCPAPSAVSLQGSPTFHHHHWRESRIVFSEHLISRLRKERIDSRTHTHVTEVVERRLLAPGERHVPAAARSLTTAGQGLILQRFHRTVTPVRFERVFVTRGRSARHGTPTAPRAMMPRLDLNRGQTEVRSVRAVRRLARRLGRAPAGVRAEAARVRPRLLSATGCADAPHAARRDAAIATFATVVPLTWRAATGQPAERADVPLVMPRASTSRKPAADPSSGSRSANRGERAREPAPAKPQSPLLDSSTIDRLADNVMYRLDRRLRIERERRGL
jgi:hypothetical protein